MFGLYHAARYLCTRNKGKTCGRVPLVESDFIGRIAQLV